MCEIGSLKYYALVKQENVKKELMSRKVAVFLTVCLGRQKITWVAMSYEGNRKLYIILTLQFVLILVCDTHFLHDALFVFVLFILECLLLLAIIYH